MARYFTKDGDMVDAICQAHYGRTNGTVEAVLAANPKLASYPEQLPAGLVLELPAVATKAVQTVSLWD